MCADNLFYVSRANIFSIYPKILQKLIVCDDMAYSPDKNFVTLPSDFDWQLRCYFRLLEQQKKINLLENKADQELSQIEPLPPLPPEAAQKKQTSRELAPTPVFSPISPNADRNLIKPLGDCDEEFRLSVSHETNSVLWDLSEFAKAGKLLKNPPMDVEFYDEYEMRKVYSLIYDVFRFKLVLNKTLDSIEFLRNFPELNNDQPRVWLLLYDLYLRTFAKRKPELLPLKDKLFKESEMLYIETCLDKMKTKLAASITKIRIEKQALNLQFLLPVHLRDEKVARAVTNPIISGWINKFKGLTRAGLARKFESWGYRELQGDAKSHPKSFRFDKVCPNYFFLWYPKDKSEFSQDSLVKNQEVILQNKAFSVGPAIFAKLLNYYEIAGDILQTHILSPRSTAYLASLLIRNRFVGKIRVFGAGDNLKEYQAYFDSIGVNNIKLYQEKFLGFPRGILEKTVAIYCTPPSSFSSISDPIELICSRGGDLKMLQFLSESEMNDDGQLRAAKILEEQRNSLKSAMSKPQIQFILYETHSIVEAENEDMVRGAMEYVNRKARDKHILKAQKERERLEQIEKEKENMPGIPSSHREPREKKEKPKEKKKPEPSASVKINLNKLKSVMKSGGSSTESLDQLVEAEEEGKPKDQPLEVRVAQTDLFEVSPIPDFCENKDNCVMKRSEGCFLSLLKRREIVRMDSKYLIQIAELRGIFGDKDKPKKTKSKAQLRAEKKQEAAMKKAREALERQKIEKFNPSNIDKTVERLLKPTQATIIRITRDEIWRRRYHIATLRYNQLFPPRCARCDYYSQNYYFLSDKFVAIKQFDDTISLRFDENLAFQQSVTKRRAEKWWSDLIKYMKRLRMVADMSGAEFSLELIDKSDLPPLKLVRFPRGYIAPPIKRKVTKGIRQQYSLSITLLDIDHPVRRMRLKTRSRSVTPRLLTLKNYNKCFMCLNEYLRMNSSCLDSQFMVNSKAVEF